MHKYVAVAFATFGWLAVAVHAVSLPEGTIPGNFAVQLKAGDMNAETLDKVRDLGVKWVRRGFIWEGIEKEKGVYDFSKYDEFVKLCKERGLGVMACLAFNNKLYGHVKDEPGRSAYAAWAAAMVEHFKDENVLWELWNEPNTMTFWGKHGKKGNSEEYAREYTDLVKVTVPAMKKANPKCIILAGSVSNMWTESYKWMSYCFKEGMLKQDWDIWSVHPYGLKAPEDYLEAYAITRKLMDDAGGPSHRLWINSERGFPVKKAEGFGGGSEAMLPEYQAWHLVRQYLIDMLEGIVMTSWYEWGGNEGFALYKADGPTPAYKACQVLIDQLTGYRLDKRVSVESPRDFVLRFVDKAGNLKFVAWTTAPKGESPDATKNHAIELPVEAAGPLEGATIYGEKQPLEFKEGRLTLNLTGAPQYIAVRPSQK